ncbi:LPS export ABC transporter periplasmic protein LptC [Halanaerobaculum tunisiense]
MRIIKNKQLIVGLIWLILVSSPVVAAQTGQLKSDHLKYNKQENVLLATANVQLDYSGQQITAQQLKLDREQQVAYFSKQVHLIGSEQEIWSQKLEYDLQEEILIASQEVELVSQKQNKEFRLTSAYLKLWTTSNDLVAKQDVQLDYDGQQIKGQRLEYNAPEEEIVVTDQAEIKEDGNWIAAQKVVISLADNTIDATGAVEMEFEITE